MQQATKSSAAAEHSQMEQARQLYIIDDDEGVRQLLSMLLRRAGHEASEARDGREGIALRKPSASTATGSHLATRAELSAARKNATPLAACRRPRRSYSFAASLRSTSQALRTCGGGVTDRQTVAETSLRCVFFERSRAASNGSLRETTSRRGH